MRRAGNPDCGLCHNPQPRTKSQLAPAVPSELGPRTSDLDFGFPALHDTESLRISVQSYPAQPITIAETINNYYVYVAVFCLPY